IRKDKMEDAYSLLTFVHHPERDNFEMFKLAQGLINRNYKKVEYEINEINIDENVASVKVDIIFVPPTKDRPHIKVESQMFFYKPENSEIWFLVSGNQDSRMLFIQKISDKFPLIEDKTLYLKDGSWVEEL
ncbi:MAG: hypothetical protein WC002_10315, partial [Candidatus Muiribacteriota bacterium]